MCVSVCMCVHVRYQQACTCVYGFVYICAYIYVCINKHVFQYVFMGVSINVCVPNVCVFLNVCLLVCVCFKIFVQSVCMRVYNCLCLLVCVYTCVCLSMCV